MAPRARAASTGNVLYYGDNLEILRDYVGAETIDLVYLDPPFNSDQSYNVLFGQSHGAAAKAQIQAFDDTWTWTPDTDRLYADLLRGKVPAKVAETVEAFHKMMGEGAVLAYLVMMTPRLVELHHVLKPTGSIYLHCDPTASHYLKVLLDSIFGTMNFQNELIWKRTSAHSDARRGGRVHDVILFYTKSDSYTWNQAYQEYDPEYVEGYYRYSDPDGRKWKSGDLTAPGGRGPRYEWKGVTRNWRVTQANMEKLEAEGLIFYTRNGIPRLKQYLDEAPGMPLQDIWNDVQALRSWHTELLGYPTQKPLALLERIIRASSNQGDLVLDPFCGCGTTVHAAQALGRRWIGIDITYIAIDLIRRRLEDAFGSAAEFEIHGIPRDVGGARALFAENPLDFERWAVSEVFGQPNERQVGDRGFDGIIRFPTGKKEIGRALVSVKGGKSLNPAMVRDLKGTVETEKAEMGVLVVLEEPTRGMKDAANKAGSYQWPVNGRAFPKVQIITIKEILDGKRPNMPTALTPYLAAPKHVPEVEQGQLGNGA